MKACTHLFSYLENVSQYFKPLMNCFVYTISCAGSPKYHFKPLLSKLIMGTVKSGQLTFQQAQRLENIYKENPYPDHCFKVKLASDFHVSLRTLNRWLLKKRKQDRKILGENLLLCPFEICTFIV